MKENRPQLYEDVAACFASPPEGALKAGTPEKGHGRIGQRCIQASTGLNDYLDWSRAQRVFRVDRSTGQVRTGAVTRETVYGITSLGAEQAGPRQLLSLARGHWNMENGLH